MSQKKDAKGPAHRAVKANPVMPMRSYREMQFMSLNPIRNPSWMERAAERRA